MNDQVERVVIGLVLVTLFASCSEQKRKTYTKDELEFAQKIQDRNATYLCDPESAYLKCLGVSVEQCLDSFSEPVDCLSESQMKVPKLDGEDFNSAEVGAFGAEFMQCNVNKQVSLLGRTRSQIDECLATDPES